MDYKRKEKLYRGQRKRTREFSNESGNERYVREGTGKVRFVGPQSPRVWLGTAVPVNRGAE